jgi:hypothetical protein
MRRNCFDHVPEISEQLKTGYWKEKSARFNKIYVTSNISPGVYWEIQTQKAYTSTKASPRLSKNKYDGLFLQEQQ